MSIPTVALDETSPAGSQAINLGDNRIREFKTQVREVMGVDHKFESSGQDADMGKHNQVSLLEQADIGSGAEGKPILGAQTVSGKAELVFTDEDDNDIALTSAGALNLVPGRVTNNTFLKSIDNAGTGTVDLIKANASDIAVINDGAELETSAAPTTDAGIANKKYVDDTSKVVQVVRSISSSLVSGSTTLPYDDSIPQSSEGVELLTRAITPTSASNLLKIEVCIQCAMNTTAIAIIALFQDSTANALAAATQGNTSDSSVSVSLIYHMTAGTTSSTTFKVRGGSTAGVNFYMNGKGSGSRVMGGVMCSSITITEYKA